MARLSAKDLRQYRIHSNLSLREVAAYCEVCHQLIEKVENGERELTDANYSEIVKGINAAKTAKANGTFKIPDDKPKSKPKTKKSNKEGTTA